MKTKTYTIPGAIKKELVVTSKDNFDSMWIKVSDGKKGEAKFFSGRSGYKASYKAKASEKGKTKHLEYLCDVMFDTYEKTEADNATRFKAIEKELEKILGKKAVRNFEIGDRIIVNCEHQGDWYTAKITSAGKVIRFKYEDGSSDNSNNSPEFILVKAKDKIYKGGTFEASLDPMTKAKAKKLAA